MVEEIRSPWNFKIAFICWNFLTLAFNLFSSTADHCVTLINESDESLAAVRQCCVIVLEKSPCPRGSSRTNLQVLVLVLGQQSP